MRKMFAEILKDVSEAPDFEDKVMILQNNNQPVVRQLLLAALDPNVKFDVIVPSYKENDEPDGYASNTLYIEHRRLYVFMDSYRQVSPQRKSALLGQILESIDPSDAVALINIIKKDLSSYGITKELVNAAFPGLVK
jgi:hypothetical protein